MNEYFQALDNEVKLSLKRKLCRLEELLKADVIFIYGDIFYSEEIIYRDLIEDLQDKKHHKKLAIILTTPGGDVITVEKLVNINRHFYEEVDFIVPDMAMSAGTVFCLSGDRIFMEYSSSLGPIDPQVYSSKQNQWLAAAGYIDEMKNAIEKSKNGTLTDAEFLLIRELDVAF